MVIAGNDEHVINIESDKCKLIAGTVKPNEYRMVHGAHFESTINKTPSNVKVEPSSTLLQPVKCLLQLPDPILLP